MINEPLLRALCPRPRSGASRQKAWDGYVAALCSEDAAKLFERFEVTTNRRMAHFLSNGAHESGGFTIIWESGAYSAERIMQVFGVGKHSAGVTWAEAQRLAYNGPKLFDRVYGIGNPRKAAELGNDRPGDGWRYRGVSWMQITGKRDHYKYAAKVGCPVEDLQKPINGIHAALLEWDAKGCNKWADTDDYVKVRRLINGGRNGLADVRNKLAKVKTLLASQAPPPPLPERPEPRDDTIRLGSEGPLVTWLQERLTLHGYYVGAIDGKFEIETEKQLVAWQHQHGFTANGIFDPDDAEQRDALNISKVSVAPKRDVTAQDLKDRGSETIQSTSWWKGALKWLFGLNAAAAAEHASGLGAVDAVVSQGEQVRGLVDRTGALVGWLPDAKVLILIAIGIGLYVLWRAFDNAEKRRVEEAASGRNMGR